MNQNKTQFTVATYKETINSSCTSEQTGTKTFVSSKQFRHPIKTGPWKNKKKPRALGCSLVATDTPEKNEIENYRKEAQKRKETKSKKIVRKVSESSSEEECRISKY